ncbi:MAG: sugar transferase [Pyrinomonadaceae bacterium]
MSDTERVVKRLFDLVISALALILIAPFWLILALLIKLNSRGRVLFRQERVGMDGRKFLCYKFRTMRDNSDPDVHREIYRKNIKGQFEANVGDEKEPVFGKVKNDPRVTGMGKWLRRLSLDELPQLINVVKGDMSIVGPRPPIPYEVAEYDSWHRRRLGVKPGITGLSQVSGRNRLPFEDMVRVDLFYIENWSFLLDLKIIIRTLPAVFRGDGAK